MLKVIIMVDSGVLIKNLEQAVADYDVVIVGGGIQGAGVAQVCALNNLKVLLLEQFTIASQTSSRSSKLIHGGLRYLESWQWSLVRECLRERKILLEIAPDLVKLVPFYIPVYAQTSRSSFMIRLGLSLYAVLGGLAKESRFKKIPKPQWGNLQGLTVNSLKAVYQYYDAQTDDRLLTQAVIASAIEQGAVVKEHCQFLTANDEGGVLGFRYKENSESKKITQSTTKLIINAAGPWANQVLQKFTPKPTMQELDMVQGTHIVLQYPLEKMYYLESEQDGRAVFAMPWKGNTLVGTTETHYSGEPESVTPTQKEINYLQEVFFNYFPEVRGVALLDSFAGLRVFLATGDAVFSKSRETNIVCDNNEVPRVISIFGGKLTVYRHTAELVYKLIATAFGIPASKFISTRNIKLRS